MSWLKTKSNLTPTVPQPNIVDYQTTILYNISDSSIISFLKNDCTNLKLC